MRILNHYGFRLMIAALLIAFGISKLLAQLFLGQWDVLSAGESDIAARGVWLLGLYLPAFTVGSIAVAAVLSTTLTRRTGERLSSRIGVSVLGGTVGALLVFFGADPTALLLNPLPWSSPFAYYATSAALAVLIFGLGVVFVVRLSRARRLVKAAV